MEDDTAVREDTVGREAARQAVGLVLMTVAAVVLTLAERKAADPDFMRTVRMVSARQCERAAAGAAAGLWKVAERARRAYEAERA